MGRYLNLGNDGFQSVSRNRYVDKSGLISYINGTLGTADKLTCVSRPRRFGKSFAAKMLCAYYDKSCHSNDLFENLEIYNDVSYHKYLNQYNVIYLDITWFISTVNDIKDTVKHLQKEVIKELQEAFGERSCDKTSLPVALSEISTNHSVKFIIIIDEWDALFREAKEESKLQEEYIQLLRGLFKSSQTDKMIEAAYMTGILPIKKYGTQSALTDFREYTMIQPKKLAKYVGFTEAEVIRLCSEYGMDFDEMKKWYDGYSFSKEKSIYSPNSVIEAVKNEEFGTYWTETETYESLKTYINMNLDGLKDAIISMLGGQKFKINTRKFQNDMTNINNKDDVMTLLVHLGYLAFDSVNSEVFIPNLEVAEEFKNAIEEGDWGVIAEALNDSEQLLKDTFNGNADKVAERIDAIHMYNTSILSYNDENSLSCAITIAYYYAQKDYIMLREFTSGKGYADIAFLPRKGKNIPAIIVELKWDKSAYTAICQIKEKKYMGVLKNYTNDLLLVGINYDKKSKKHECIIEKNQ